MSAHAAVQRPSPAGITDTDRHADSPDRTRRLVLLAAPRSLCAGVERAIDTVERLLASRAPGGGPVYVRKQIVHNTHVVADLAARGAVFVDELADIPDPVPHDAVVVFSAHGVAPAVRSEAARRGLRVVDATCPLVTKVHSEARRAAARGDTIVLIGHEGHEEIDGTRGEAPEQTILLQTPEDAGALTVPDPGKITYLTQTTLAVDETAATIAALTARFPHATGPGADDICYATTNRQNAVVAIAADADLVLVVGSANSSNSVRLAELARRHGAVAHLIDRPADIDPAWLDGVRAVGVTAGASAPPYLVRGVVDYLASLGPVQVEERAVAIETIRFAPARQPGTGRETRS